MATHRDAAIPWPLPFLLGLGCSGVRIKTPTGLKLAGIVYLILPVGNFLHAYVEMDGSCRRILASYSVLALVLFISAPIIAAGLLRVRRWAYFAFLAHVALLVGYSGALLLAESTVARGGELFRSAVALIALGYFLQREIAASYLNPGWRGFRRRPRRLIQTGVQIGERRISTRDLSVLGCDVATENSELAGYAPGSALRIELQLHHGLTLSLNAQVIRVDVRGIGLRFQTTRASRRAIREFMTLVYPEGFLLNKECHVELAEVNSPAALLDLSHEGAYVSVESPPAVGAIITVCIREAESTLQLTGVVVWTNPEGHFERASGAGIRFQDLGKRELQWISRTIKTGEKAR